MPHPLLFSANQIIWSRLLIQIQILNGKQCRFRSVCFFRSQLIWTYTVCKGRTYPGSAGQGLSYQKIFLGNQKWVWISQGKQAIGVPVIEALRYSGTFNTYHSCPKISTNLFSWTGVSKNCWKSGKQHTCRSGSNIWYESTLFAQAYLSEYLGLIQYKYIT